MKSGNLGYNNKTFSGLMMLKRSLAFSFGLLFFGVNAFGNVWYSENFDNFKEGGIAGQDDWKTAMNQNTCQISSEVKRGDTGKSILITEDTMVVRSFEGTHDGIQYVLLFTQRVGEKSSSGCSMCSIVKCIRRSVKKDT